MLETIAIILIVLWLLGVVSGVHTGQLHLRTAGRRDRAVPGATRERPTGGLIHELRDLELRIADCGLMQSFRSPRSAIRNGHSCLTSAIPTSTTAAATPHRASNGSRRIKVPRITAMIGLTYALKRHGRDRQMFERVRGKP